MVGASGKVGRNALCHSDSTCLQCAAHRAARPCCHGIAPRETYFAQNFGVHRAVRYSLDVIGGVGKSQFAVGYRGGLLHSHFGLLHGQCVAQHLVLCHREPVARW